MHRSITSSRSSSATALTHGLTLITTDTDFERVPGLALLRLDRSTFQPLAR